MMPGRLALGLPLAALLVVTPACTGPKRPPDAVVLALDTPEATFRTLQAAVAARDIEAFGACFAPDSEQRRGMVEQLEKDPRFWSQLDGVLVEPQTLTLKGDPDKVLVGGKLKARVDAPAAAKGGVGGMTFVRTAGGWRVLAW